MPIVKVIILTIVNITNRFASHCLLNNYHVTYYILISEGYLHYKLRASRSTLYIYTHSTLLLPSYLLHLVNYIEPYHLVQT